MHKLPLQIGSVSQMSLVVVKCVVEVGDWAVCTQTHTSFLHQCAQTTALTFHPRSPISRLTMKLVQASQMIEERFQRLGDRKELQEAVDDDIKDGQEAQAHVAEVDGQVLRLELHGRVDLVCKALEVQLLWVFLVKENQKNTECSVLALSIHLSFFLDWSVVWMRWMIREGSVTCVPCGSSCAWCASRSAASAQERSPWQNR